MYDFNLLISHHWNSFALARREIRDVLKQLGDIEPRIIRTRARGLTGVKTVLDSRKVILEVQRLFEEDPLILLYAVKWVPIDAWTFSEIDAIKEVVKQLKDRIHEGERWRMTVEKRRYTMHHKIEIIIPVAELIDEKVDLENPDKILYIELIGRYAGISVLRPQEIFSILQ